MPAIDSNTNFIFQPIRNKGRLKNLNSQRFGKLLVIGLLGRSSKKTWWLCTCDCGNLTVTITGYLTTGDTLACGCLLGRTTKHGLKNTKVYHAWICAKMRCYNPNNEDYGSYKTRGMCSAWRTSFKVFFTDIGHPPSPKHSIERINNNLGYHCGHCNECSSNNWTLNCRWDTATNQSRNRRTNVYLSYRGKTKTVAEWAETLGVNYKKFWRRQNKLRDPELIFAPYFS